MNKDSVTTEEVVIEEEEEEVEEETLAEEGDMEDLDLKDLVENMAAINMETDKETDSIDRMIEISLEILIEGINKKESGI